MCYETKTEVIEKLLDFKDGLTQWGINSDLSEISEILQSKAKDHFPMNEVPEDLYESLITLEIQLNIAKEQLNKCVDLMIENFIK